MKIPLETRSSDVPANYEPTAEDRQKLRLKDDHFLLSGDGVFHVIQGEGLTIGRPATFVRLQLCNLNCSWCDAWYTWRQDRQEYYAEPSHLAVADLRSVIEAEQQDKGVDHFIPRVVFTGGEPLIQADRIEAFMNMNPDVTVEIETNGTIMPSDFLLQHVQWNCSPKTSNSGNDETRCKKDDVLTALSKHTSHFKFVCKTVSDLEEVVEKFSFLPREQIFIMPEGLTKEEHYEVYKNINAALLKYGLNTTPRLQSIMYDRASRRV